MPITAPLPQRAVVVHPVVLLYALRYALGRTSTAVCEVADQVAANLRHMPPPLLVVAQRDVEEHLGRAKRSMPAEPADVTALWLALAERFDAEIARREQG